MLQEINVYDEDVLGDIVLSGRGQIESRTRIKELLQLLQPYYLSPFGGGQMAKPNSKSVTNDTPIINLTSKAKVVKNPLTNAATAVSLKISNMLCDRTLLRSQWNMAIISPDFQGQLYHSLKDCQASNDSLGKNFERELYFQVSIE